MSGPDGYHESRCTNTSEKQLTYHFRTYLIFYINSLRVLKNFEIRTQMETGLKMSQTSESKSAKLNLPTEFHKFPQLPIEL